MSSRGDVNSHGSEGSRVALAVFSESWQKPILGLLRFRHTSLLSVLSPEFRAGRPAGLGLGSEKDPPTMPLFHGELASCMWVR